MEKDNAVTMKPPVSDLLSSSFRMAENQPGGRVSANLNVGIGECGNCKVDDNPGIRVTLNYSLSLRSSEKPDGAYLDFSSSIRSVVPIGARGRLDAINQAVASAYSLAVTVANLEISLSSQQRLPLPPISTNLIVEHYLEEHPGTMKEDDA